MYDTLSESQTSQKGQDNKYLHVEIISIRYQFLSLNHFGDLSSIIFKDRLHFV